MYEVTFTIATMPSATEERKSYLDTVVSVQFLAFPNMCCVCDLNLTAAVDIVLMLRADQLSRDNLTRDNFTPPWLQSSSSELYTELKEVSVWFVIDSFCYH